jgi:acyl-homoserine-lactone acylase
MRKLLLLAALLPFSLCAQNFTEKEIKEWEAQAKNVTIIRDNWGIPHIYGKTDADAVFGLLYAQCEDDFKRVEMNYVEKLGRMAEIKGESEWHNDLYIKLIIDSADAVADYKKSPQWLKQLMNAFAAGINYYLYKHPEVKPALLTRFKPWYPLLWTDGSIGAISTGDVTEDEVKSFYGGSSAPAAGIKKQSERELAGSGSNGFAIAPSRTEGGNALLYINPHVTFYFRPEVQVMSEEGLNVYGAVTWGQFFVYQGFNEHCGWMHTSSNVDVADMYAEKVTAKGNKFFYEYDGKQKAVKQKQISIGYKAYGTMQTKTITAYYTGHGPVMAKRNGQWISVKGNNRSLTSLVQSWQRTKATGYEDYRRVMELRSNTSNNTVFADDKGNIAYWHGNFVPVRDKSINWGKAVDGSTKATDWQGIHPLGDIVQVHNPATGWIQNCNSTPFTVSGSSSPKKENYPRYMAPDGENFRGVNAARILAAEKTFTIDKLIQAGYNKTLAAFEVLVPALVSAYEKTSASGDSSYAELKDAIRILKQWNYQVGEKSVATTLAVEWAQKLTPLLQKVYVEDGENDQVENTKQFAATALPKELLAPLQDVLTELKVRFDKWQVPWGELNCFQRLSGDLEQKFNDYQPGTPVPFAASTWGMLPACNSKYFPGTNKRYGVGGNSFVCAVEFGKRIKAKSLLAGGQSGDVRSKHFSDQLEMYTKGKFKEVLFYKEDVIQHAEKTYHPGE